MLIDGITIMESSSGKLVVASGAEFPANPTEGELFFKTDSGLHIYQNSVWEKLATKE